MSIGDCLAKVGVDPKHEEAILRGVDDLVTKKRMSEAGAAERVLKREIAAVEAEHADIVKQIEAQIPKNKANPEDRGAADHVALANHIVEHGPIDTAPKREVTPPKQEAPIQAKEPTEHVAAREATVQDAAKDIIINSPASGQHIDKAIKAGPKDARTLVDAINAAMKKNKDRVQTMTANAAIDRLNKGIGEKLRDNPDMQYSMMREHTKDERRAGPEHMVSEADIKHVEKYINDAFGGKIKVAWSDTMHAGDFTHTPGDKKNGIDPIYALRVSVHALDPQGTAYHESLHALFAHLREQGNKDVIKVLARAAETAPVLNQLKKLLKDEPEALKQLDNREERIAYMYQFYAQEKLTLGTDTRNVFGKIKDFLYKVMGMWTNDERAMHIMDYFGQGEFAKNIGDREATTKALIETHTNKTIEYAKNALQPFVHLERAVLSTGAARLRNSGLPSLMELADHIQPALAGDATNPGFIQSVNNERMQRMNTWVQKLKGISADEIHAAGEAMRRGEKGANAREQQVIDATQKHLREMLGYMKTAGVDVGDRGPDYFPRVWNPEFISKNQDAFKAMMAKYETSGKFKGNVQDVMNKLMARDGMEQGVVVDMPGMQHVKSRVLDFITAEDAAPFLEKNLFQTVKSYTDQAARRAEWAKRFGDDGKGMRKLIDRAKADGAAPEELDMAQDFIRGIDGTLGDNVNPIARRLMGNMIVYQNVRLLPLMIFSSLIDPGGIMVRGGTMGDAFKAFKRGVMEIPRGFKKNAERDEWYQLAQDMGTIDDTTLVHALGSAYTQGMVSETARKVNDTFFKYNLGEQFNTSMRVSATEAASRFLARHADGKNSEHSERWLAELGLKPNEVIVKDGHPLVRQAEFMAHGMGEEEAASASNKMRGALNRWVDGAILRPNAADKPIWMNDARFVLFAHLKQFTYAFQNTILKRVWNEAEYGNYAPAAALASYVPVMMAADFMKGFIQGGGQQPTWKENWGASDYVGSGIQRAGLLGVGQYGSDIIKDIRQGGAGINAVLGPTFEQGLEGLKTLAGHEMFKTFAMHSLPANALYSHAFHEASTDPNFSE